MDSQSASELSVPERFFGSSPLYGDRNEQELDRLYVGWLRRYRARRAHIVQCAGRHPGRRESGCPSGGRCPSAYARRPRTTSRVTDKCVSRASARRSSSGGRRQRSTAPVHLAYENDLQLLLQRFRIEGIAAHSLPTPAAAGASPGRRFFSTPRNGRLPSDSSTWQFSHACERTIRRILMRGNPAAIHCIRGSMPNERGAEDRASKTPRLRLNMVGKR